MSNLSERYGKCDECGAYAVHLATREVVEFAGDQDDNLDEASAYGDACIEIKYGVRLFALVCFECNNLESVGIEWPRDKAINTCEHQWTSGWPDEPGNYWFYGWLLEASPFDKPEMTLVEMFLCGDGKLTCVGKGEFIYKTESLGLWAPANLPEPPTDQLEGTEW
jgi:hypothetical protein